MKIRAEDDDVLIYRVSLKEIDTFKVLQKEEF
jgi:hypothetical protein